MTTNRPSRRDFLATSGVSLVGATGVAAGNRSDPGQRSDADPQNDPDIETLREKWFLEFDGEDVAFPPSERQFDLDRYVSADVEVLYDGAAYMEEWYENATHLTETAPEQSEIYHQTLRMREVELLGATDPDSLNTDVIQAAHDAGVDHYYMLSGDVQHGAGNAEIADELGIDTIVTDTRVAQVGSMHQKVSIFRGPDMAKATIGSADLYPSRWGERPYEADNDDRPSGGPNHDLSVLLEGPVVRDLQQIHIDRWNDPSRTGECALGQTHTPPEIETTPIESDVDGDQEVQILQTYGRSRNDTAYTWSDEGEFTAWAGYINAIQEAEEYIYLECQFLMAEGRPVWHRAGGQKAQSSLYYQLGEALKRGVDVIATTTTPTRDETDPYVVLDYNRDDGINYLDEIAEDAPGDFEVANIFNDEGQSVYIHSKMMLVDDEVTFIGSMNTGRRSLTTDGEIHLAIIDEANEFTQDFRTELWRVYMGEDPDSEEVPDGLEPTAEGPETFISAIRDGTGLLQRFDRNPDVEFVYPHYVLNYVGSPYSGPPIGGGLPPIDGDREPLDILGDGLYRDVRGTGRLSIFDIQALFNAMGTPELEDHAPSYAFANVDSSPDSVSVVDVQALFDQHTTNLLKTDIPLFGGITLDGCANLEDTDDLTLTTSVESSDVQTLDEVEIDIPAFIPS